MLPYVILLLLGILSRIPILVSRKGSISVKQKVLMHTNMILPIFFFFLVVGLIGLRHEVGTDYYSYIWIFEEIARNNEILISKLEPGYVLLNRVVFTSGLPAHGVFVLAAAITFFMLYHSSLSHKNAPGLALLILLSFGPVFSMTNIVRQYLAIAICVYSTVKCSKNPPIVRLLGIALASLFHYSAVVFLLSFLVPRKRLNPFALLIAIFVAFVVWKNAIPLVTFLVVSIPIVGEKFGNYLLSSRLERVVAGLGFRIYFELGMLTFLSFFTKRLSRDNLYYFNLSFCGILISVAFQDVAVFARISSYFYIFMFMAIPAFIVVPKSREGKDLFMVAVTIYCAFLFIRALSSPQLVPYRTIIFS